jgi:VanZ family protein
VTVGRLDVIGIVNKKSLAWTAVSLYAVLIFIGSSVPGDRLGLDPPGLDKLLHVIEYMILSCLLFPALRLTLSTKRETVFWAVAVGGSLYGLTDEVHQIFVPLRQFDILDITCDISGSFLGSYVLFRARNNA